MTTFEMEAMIRGYHVYQAVWNAQIGEELSCVTERENVRDPFAVAVKKSNLTVGHIPKKISALCSLFLPIKNRTIEMHNNNILHIKYERTAYTIY